MSLIVMATCAVPKRVQANSVRIIAGKWRSRRVIFPDISGLRPSTDRIRETLFNWLAPDIVGLHCLDCFAGSGVLGFEALSRGAASVTLLESNKQIVSALEHTRQLLAAENCQIIHSVCPSRVPLLKLAPFELVFLDPPFGQNLVPPTLAWLQQQAYLKPQALIYIETEPDTDLALESPWAILREKNYKNVKSYLIRKITTNER